MYNNSFIYYATSRAVLNPEALDARALFGAAAKCTLCLRAPNCIHRVQIFCQGNHHPVNIWFDAEAAALKVARRFAGQRVASSGKWARLMCISPLQLRSGCAAETKQADHLETRGRPPVILGPNEFRPQQKRYPAHRIIHAA